MLSRTLGYNDGDLLCKERWHNQIGVDVDLVPKQNLKEWNLKQST